MSIQPANKEKLFEARLRSAGERVSSARVAIFRSLARTSPLPIPQLVHAMQQNAINPATTYRNLRLFRELNIVRDIVAGGRRLVELSDDFDTHHHHFWCQNCGKLIDFDDAELETSIAKVARSLGTRMSSHHLEISGECSECTSTGELVGCE